MDGWGEKNLGDIGLSSARTRRARFSTPEIDGGGSSAVAPSREEAASHRRARSLGVRAWQRAQGGVAAMGARTGSAREPGRPFPDGRASLENLSTRGRLRAGNMAPAPGSPTCNGGASARPRSKWTSTGPQVEAMTWAQRVAVMREGHLQDRWRRRQALYRRPDDLVRRGFHRLARR